MDDWQRLLWYYGAGKFFNPRPRWLCYNVTRRCDSKCLHCGVAEPETLAEEMPPEDLRLALAQPFFGAIRTAWLTGGEPTLRQNLAAVARVMVETLPALDTLGLATHAIRTQRVIQQILNLLDALDPKRHGLFIHVSLDGLGETHDRIRGVPGAFAGVMATLEAISELRRDSPAYRLEVGLNCVIQPENVADLPALRELAQKRGLSITFNTVCISDQIFNNREREAKLTFSPEARGGVIAFLEATARLVSPGLAAHYRQIARMLEGAPRARRCLSLWSTIILDSDGTYLPCPTASALLPISAQSRDLEEVWQGPELKAVRQRIELEFCPACQLGCSLGDSLTWAEWRQGGWKT
jgi:MoaA/NifB/PqqE/SkfB family radical SAM enzyme